MSAATDVFQEMITDAVRAAIREEMGAMPTVGKRLWTVEQAADYLALSKRTIRNMLANRELPVVPHGRRRMLDIRDLDAWIERNKLPC